MRLASVCSVLTMSVCAALTGCGMLATISDDPAVDKPGSSGAQRPQDPTRAGQQPPNEGGGAATQSPSPPPAKVVFVSSTTLTDQQLNGVLGADTLCDQLAAASSNPAVNGRAYNAWLSDWNVSAATRLVHILTPYVRPDGKRVAENFAALVAGLPLENAISIDETGNTQSGSVWTWTRADGNAGTGCSGTNTWGFGGGGGPFGGKEQQQQQQNPTIGTITSAAREWTDAQTTLDCKEGEAHIYCFER